MNLTYQYRIGYVGFNF